MRRFLIVVERANHNFSAYSPDLPGCVATGSTIEETRSRMHEAIDLHIKGLKEDRLPIPEYPGHFLVKKVTTGGTFRFRDRLLYLANAMVDQHIGLEETDDGIWTIHFNTVLLATFDERADMISPHRQRSPHLSLVGTAIVDASRTGTVAGVVVQHGLDHMRLHAEVGHSRCHGATQIMQAPSLHFRAEALI